MFKIALMKFEGNLAVNIDGGKRQSYKKGEKVIVGKNDILLLLRLGCTLINERFLNYEEHKDLFKVTKNDIQKANEKFEKNIRNMTGQQLSEFVKAPQFVIDCDKKYCTNFANSVLVEEIKIQEKKVKAEEKAKEEIEQEKKEEIEREKAEAKKLDEEKKFEREKQEAKNRKKAQEGK